MEEDLDCHLFRRVGKRAVLTEAGERLLHYCEEILHKMQDARLDLSQLPDVGRKALRIGAPMTICQHLIPGVLRRLQQEFPHSDLCIETGDNPHLLAQLLAGRIDLAVVVEPGKSPELAFEPLFQDELCFVVPPTHPWVDAEEITVEQIRRATLIVANKATRTHQLIASYFRAKGIRLAKRIEFGSIESIKELVKNDLGVGVVALWPIEAELRRGELVSLPLGRKPLVRHWQTVHLRERTPSASETAFVRLLREAGNACAKHVVARALQIGAALISASPLWDWFNPEVCSNLS
jgi:DNA-binding transcriptional LysR family regulator